MCSSRSERLSTAVKSRASRARYASAFPDSHVVGSAYAGPAVAFGDPAVTWLILCSFGGSFSSLTPACVLSRECYAPFSTGRDGCGSGAQSLLDRVDDLDRRRVDPAETGQVDAHEIAHQDQGEQPGQPAGAAGVD